MHGVDYVVHAAALQAGGHGRVQPVRVHPDQRGGFAERRRGGDRLPGCARSWRCPRTRQSFPSTSTARRSGAPRGCSSLANHLRGPPTKTQLRGRAVRQHPREHGESVVPLFKRHWPREGQSLPPPPLTDKRMTRFWITLPQAVQFVIKYIVGPDGLCRQSLPPSLPP